MLHLVYFGHCWILKTFGYYPLSLSISSHLKYLVSTTSERNRYLLSQITTSKVNKNAMYQWAQNSRNNLLTCLLIGLTLQTFYTVKRLRSNYGYKDICASQRSYIVGEASAPHICKPICTICIIFIHNVNSIHPLRIIQLWVSHFICLTQFCKSQ